MQLRETADFASSTSTVGHDLRRLWLHIAAHPLLFHFRGKQDAQHSVGATVLRESSLAACAVQNVWVLLM